MWSGSGVQVCRFVSFCSLPSSLSLSHFILDCRVPQFPRKLIIESFSVDDGLPSATVGIMTALDVTPLRLGQAAVGLLDEMWEG